MSILFVFTLISLLIAGMQLTWPAKHTEVNMKRKPRKKEKMNLKGSQGTFILMMMNLIYCLHGELQFSSNAFAFCLGFATVCFTENDTVNDFSRTIHSQNIFRKGLEDER